MYIGKGALYLAISQAVMLAAGYVIHVGVGRLLGPTSYGVFALSLSVFSSAFPRHFSHSFNSIRLVRK